MSETLEPHTREMLVSRIERRLSELGMSARAASLKATGSDNTIRHILTGASTNPRMDTVRKIAATLETSVEWLTGQTDLPDPPPSSTQSVNQSDLVQIPDLAIFGGAGNGGELDVYVDADSGDILDPDQVRGYWSLPDYMVRSLGALKNIYAWEVRGDSMEPTLPGGSVVFVDTSQCTPPPDDIYAINYGDGLMVKRLKLIPRSDRVSVISDNARYGSDDLLRTEVHIWGRVVGWFQWRG